MTSELYKYTLEVNMAEPCAESPIMEMVVNLQNEARRLDDDTYNAKALAINTKWQSLSFLRAEIHALDKQYASSTTLLLLDKSLIISKIEMYLTTARAIFDIVTYCLTRSLQLSGSAQSFNDLRKRGDLPDWLADFLSVSMKYDETKSMSKNGWLLNLLTDDAIHGKSLRDFVMHGGTIDLQCAEQFNGDYRFSFKTRKNDQNLYHIEDMVENVYSGMCGLFNLIIKHLGQGLSEIKQSPPAYPSGSAEV